jgi:dipeptidase E
MKLVLYSGGDESLNELLNQRLLELGLNVSRGGKKKEDLQITFIPADQYFSHLSFHSFSKYWNTMGVEKILFFPLDQKNSHRLKEEVFKSDIIYLSGGNTFEFLLNLRKYKILSMLKQFVNNGGVLAGLSAGAIMMTPSIATASFPSFDCDENLCHLKNWKSLSLANFEFFPHYKNSQRYNQELSRYSKKISHPLLAMADGDGIIIEDSKMEVIGSCRVFLSGKSSWLND